MHKHGMPVAPAFAGFAKGRTAVTHRRYRAAVPAFAGWGCRVHENNAALGPRSAERHLLMML
jgi:hypothetical protein